MECSGAWLTSLSQSLDHMSISVYLATPPSLFFLSASALSRSLRVAACYVPLFACSPGRPFFSALPLLTPTSERLLLSDRPVNHCSQLWVQKASSAQSPWLPGPQRDCPFHYCKWPYGIAGEPESTWEVLLLRLYVPLSLFFPQTHRLRNLTSLSVAECWCAHTRSLILKGKQARPQANLPGLTSVNMCMMHMSAQAVFIRFRSSECSRSALGRCCDYRLKAGVLHCVLWYVYI